MVQQSPDEGIKIIVTGHSRGLGAALTRASLRRGAWVWGISRGQLRMDQTEALDGRLQQTSLDLSDDRALLEWLAKDPWRDWLEGSFVAILVNNAAVLGPVGRVEDGDPREIARAIKINVGAPLVLTSAFAYASAGIPDRRVAHVSSGAARHSLAGWSIYCASKAALDHHARTLALTADHGFRIASIAPGILDTDMQTQVRGLDPTDFPDHARFRNLYQQGRLCSPDVAAERLLDLLMSDTYGDDPIVDLWATRV